jgi:hypothetical protein
MAFGSNFRISEGEFHYQLLFYNLSNVCSAHIVVKY